MKMSKLWCTISDTLIIDTMNRIYYIMEYPVRDFTYEMVFMTIQIELISIYIFMLKYIKEYMLIKIGSNGTNGINTRESAGNQVIEADNDVVSSLNKINVFNNYENNKHCRNGKSRDVFTEYVILKELFEIIAMIINVLTYD